MFIHEFPARVKNGDTLPGSAAGPGAYYGRYYEAELSLAPYCTQFADLSVYEITREERVLLGMLPGVPVNDSDCHAYLTDYANNLLDV